MTSDQKVTTVYISQANPATDFGGTNDVFLQIDLKQGADRATAGKQIKALAAIIPARLEIAQALRYE